MPIIGKHFCKVLYQFNIIAIAYILFNNDIEKRNTTSIWNTQIMKANFVRVISMHTYEVITHINWFMHSGLNLKWSYHNYNQALKTLINWTCDIVDLIAVIERIFPCVYIHTPWYLWIYSKVWFWYQKVVCVRECECVCVFVGVCVREREFMERVLLRTRKRL